MLVVWLALSVLLLLVIAVAVLLISLLRGVTVDSLSLGPVEIESAFAHFDGKLSLDIARLTVSRDNSRDGSHEKRAPPSPDSDLTKVLNPSRVRDLLNGIHLLARAFKHIDIEQIEVGSFSGNFRYREHAAGHVNVQGPGVDVALDLSVDGDQLIVAIDTLNAPKFGIQGSGQVRLEPLSRQLEATLETTIGDTLPLQLKLQADRERLTFNGRGLASVASIAPIVDLFKLGPTITPWIVDYLRGREYTLGEISGSFPYDDPARILQTLHAEVQVEDVAYTFAQGLEPVIAKAAKLVFEKGILHIYPNDMTFYGQDGGGSTVDIDFNQHRVVVVVHVHTQAQFNPGIRSVLAHYGIPLPLEQLTGLTDADLTLSIDLEPLAVHTVGRFVSTDSVMQMGKQRFHVDAMDVGIKDTAITFKQLELSQPQRFSLSASGEVDVSAQQGDLSIVLDQFHWPVHNTALVLQIPAGQPPVFRYQMRPEGDTIVAPATRWRYGDLNIGVAALTTPFDLKTLSGDVPATEVSLDSWLRGRVSGRYSAHAPYADLRIALQHLDVVGLQLAQPLAGLALTAGETVELSTSSAVKLSMKGMPLELQPTRIRFAKGVLRIQDSGVQMLAGLSAGLSGEVSLTEGEGRLILRDLEISDKSGALLLAADNTVSLNMSRQGGDLRLASPQLALNFSRGATGAWTLNCTDIGLIHRQSPLLQRVGLDDGEFHLASSSGSAPYTMNGRLHSVYPILVDGDSPIHDYSFTGSYQGGQTRLTINQRLQVALAETLRIKSVGLGYNLPALTALAKANAGAGSKSKTKPKTEPTIKPTIKSTITPTTGPETKPPDQEPGAGPGLQLNASDSFIWLGKKRRVLASELMVKYAAGKVTADLQYRAGYATLEWADDKLHIAGRDFDDTFFDELIQMGDFKGGKLEFGVGGSLENLTAAVRIQDTVMSNYKALNNILAFVDTVPALLTFRLPHYDTKGLPVKDLYAKASYQGGILKLESLHLNSDELVLNGTGTLDFGAETTDMTFNVVTGLKKNVEKIPLLGYILAGNERRPSITVRVEGDLHDPKVSQTAFKKVATYPFAVIKRSLLLPVHLTKKSQRRQRRQSCSKAVI